MGALALFLVIAGGTAYAANTIASSDIINGQVKSIDIGTGAVTTADIAADAVNSSKIADGSVTGADVATNLIPGVDVANNSITGVDVASNSLDGLDVQEGSLVLDPHFSATAAPNGNCNDDNHAGTVCASASFELERPGRLLMNASGNWFTSALNDTTPPGENTDDSTAVAGSCALRIDGSSISTPLRMGEESPVGPAQPVHPANSDGTMALTDLTDTLFAGTHTVDVFCSELDGDIDWRNIRLIAARVDN
jgi:hypothetical protein